MLDNLDCYLLKFIIDIDTMAKIISITVSKKTLIPYKRTTGNSYSRYYQSSTCKKINFITLAIIIKIIIKILNIRIFFYLWGLFSLETSSFTIKI